MPLGVGDHLVFAAVHRRSVPRIRPQGVAGDHRVCPRSRRRRARVPVRAPVPERVPLAAAGTTSGAGDLRGRALASAHRSCVLGRPRGGRRTRTAPGCGHPEEGAETSLAPLGIGMPTPAFSDVYRTQLPSFCTSRRSTSWAIGAGRPTRPSPPAPSTRLPSSCNINVYAPLREGQRLPRVRVFSPFISLFAHVVTVT